MSLYANSNLSRRSACAICSAFVVCGFFCTKQNRNFIWTKHYKLSVTIIHIGVSCNGRHSGNRDFKAGIGLKVAVPAHYYLKSRNTQSGAHYYLKRLKSRGTKSGAYHYLKRLKSRGTQSGAQYYLKRLKVAVPRVAPITT